MSIALATRGFISPTPILKVIDISAGVNVVPLETHYVISPHTDDTNNITIRAESAQSGSATIIVGGNEDEPIITPGE